MSLFDWFGRGRGRRPPGEPIAWHVYRDGGDVVADDGRGDVHRAAVTGAHHVRIVPLSAGNHHSPTSGWQVALARSEGDELLGKALPDWRSARELAKLVSQCTELPLDELTRKMFSRVGEFTPAPKS